MTFLTTRANVGDYEAWKPMFDSDPPGARKAAKGHRILRSVEDPNEVFIWVEFDSADDAKVARERLLSSGVLDRFTDKTEPRIVEEAEAVSYR